MWKEEDEEKYWDLKIIHNLLKPKRTVKGDFVNDTYIKEKKVEFQLKSFFNDEISFYLPEGREEKHYGEYFLYLCNMGEYVEYVSMDNEFIFTIEKCKNENFNEELLEDDDYEDVYEKIIGGLEGKNQNISAYYLKSYKIDKYNLDINIIEILVDIDDNEQWGQIYCLSDDKNSYRFYMSSKEDTIEMLDVLGEKIMENIVYKGYTKEK